MRKNTQGLSRVFVDLDWQRSLAKPGWPSHLAAGFIAAGFVVWMIKPVGDQLLTGIAYALVLVGSALAGLLGGIFLDRRLWVSFLVSVLVGALGVGWGILRENPGSFTEGVFFVTLPAVWFLIVLGIDDRTVRVLLNVIPFAGLTIGAIGVLYWLDATGQVNAGWVNLLDLGQGLGTAGYGYSLRYYPISTMIFLLSFFFVAIVQGNTFSGKISRIVVWPATASLFILLFVSGRRALFISLAISLLAAFLLFALGRGRSAIRRRYAIAAGVGVVGAIGLGFASRFSLASMVESLADEILAGDSIRNETGSALIRSWLNSPIIGNGAGAAVEGAVRDPERPWNFELQYHLILNGFGALGFAVLATITILLLVLAVRTYRSGPVGGEYLAPIIAGTISLLVANASNPYLHTPGHYWMFFILVIGLNARLRKQRSSLELNPLTENQGGTVGSQ